ncbi:MAG: IPTL-CTERM sorting domain-containing protein [Planctomycetes bacterium]|nr:IPTL-CTERM sorting domain-containing protein [Planctomycetota bacterium]
MIKSKKLVCAGLVITAYLCVFATQPAMGHKSNPGTCAWSKPLLWKTCDNPGAACTITYDDTPYPGTCVTHQEHSIPVPHCFCLPNDANYAEDVTDGHSVPYPEAPNSIPSAPATMTFVISPGPTGSYAFLPPRFGGGTVNVTSFSGEVTMRLIPTGDANIDQIEVVDGAIIAPSVVLPNGQSTGVNLFEFIGPGTSLGVLNRTTGEFYFPAKGQITNDLFPAGRPIETLGDYSGTVDMMTGEADFDTSTIDTIPPPLTSVPTVSNWGLLMMALLLLTAGAIVIRRRLLIPA